MGVSLRDDAVRAQVNEHFVYSDALVMHVIELPKRNRPGVIAIAIAIAIGAGDGDGDGGSGTPQADAAPLAWSRFLGAKSDEEVKEACMSNPVIAKTNALLEQLSAEPSAQELVRQRKLALDTYRIEMGAAKEEGLEQGREEGRVREPREGILALAEVLGLELDEVRLAQLDRASVDELTALRARLRFERRWS